MGRIAPKACAVFDGGGAAALAGRRPLSGAGDFFLASRGESLLLAGAGV
ncbi:MAG: hypothetical protein IIA68_12885 [Proteobacteria bacterium]|nr:hypothetical protein [Pseudomonadota bacterium]